MEIERINEHTIKFFISYVDVEERGFNREDIWFNREKSEELFWEMMDEVHQKEDFSFDGPLWIQVQALEKGLEVIVTKAQITKDGTRFEIPFPDEKLKDFTVGEHIEQLLDHYFAYDVSEKETDAYDEEFIQMILEFTDFEDLIELARRPWLDHIITKLFHFKGKYYLAVDFPFEYLTEDEIEDFISVMLEYGNEAPLTLAYLEEYGKLIISENVDAVLREHFIK
ncbi:MAG: adaptor protein MecA [Caldibacillus sp.]